MRAERFTPARRKKRNTWKPLYVTVGGLANSARTPIFHNSTRLRGAGSVGEDVKGDSSVMNTQRRHCSYESDATTASDAGEAERKISLPRAGDTDGKAACDG